RAASAAVRSRRFDLLVADIATEGGIALDGIRQLRSIAPAVPILVFSGLSEIRHAASVLEAGASGYLPKDSTSELLLSVMRKLAAGGLFVSAAVAEHMARRPQTGGGAPHADLSPREHQVFMMINAGRRIGEIADDLGVSVKTVSTHKARILEKLGVDSAAGLVRYAMAHRLAAAPGAAGA
ncbi:MAG TPA: response regulator transcription factor, partial [Rhodocyclaceae bacterium]